MKNQTEKDTYVREPIKHNGKEYAILWPLWIFKAATGDERHSILVDAFNGEKDKTVYWLENSITEWEDDLMAGRTTMIFTVDEKHEKQFIQQNLSRYEKMIDARVNYRKFQRSRGKSFMMQINSKLKKN